MEELNQLISPALFFNGVCPTLQEISKAESYNFL